MLAFVALRLTENPSVAWTKSVFEIWKHPGENLVMGREKRRFIASSLPSCRIVLFEGTKSLCAGLHVLFFSQVTGMTSPRILERTRIDEKATQTQLFRLATLQHPTGWVDSVLTEKDFYESSGI